MLLRCCYPRVSSHGTRCYACMYVLAIVFDLGEPLNRFSALFWKRAHIIDSETCVTFKVMEHVLQQWLVSMKETWTRPVREAQNVVRLTS
jgi:hypothetical protein